MKRGKGPYRSSRKRPQKRTQPIKRNSLETPRLDPQLRSIFRRIGVPEPTPFQPDPFQLEALNSLPHGDVLVSAPTGAGKTWIASEAIRAHLAKGSRIWYASPLKALSNSIYRQFCAAFGDSRCGILTGDRKENPSAPVIVGTTEILRNQLYDVMHDGTRIGADLVILDEAHYLSNPERGVVWEEVLIYLPPRVRILLLSATAPNAEDVCQWLGKIRGVPNHVVRSSKRPVALVTLFLLPHGMIVPLGGKRGVGPRVRKFMAPGKRRPGKQVDPLKYGDVIDVMRKFNLLPAIFFLKSRRDCDQAVVHCGKAPIEPEAREMRRKEVRQFLKAYPHLRGHRQMRPLLDSRVGSHHGGQLPYWKVLVEDMMNRGYLEAIFSTSTVAAGVNFPARTVVLVQSDRFNGREFVDLTATELHQMMGRAGRRGKDHVGFVLVLPGRYQDPRLIHRLKDSPPDPLESQIHINFSMTLNLLLSHAPEEVKDLLARSFAAFQEGKTGLPLQKRWEKMIDTLCRMLPEGRCDTGDPFEIVENIQKRSEWKAVKAGSRSPVRYEKESKALPCEGCAHLGICHKKKGKALQGLAGDLCLTAIQMEKLGGGLWLNFKRHLRFLREVGFVDSDNRLTPDGHWATKLRLDQPLLIAEAIRNGAMTGVETNILTACLASFVWDKTQEREMGPKVTADLARLKQAFDRLVNSIRWIRTLKAKRGFDSPPILFWPAAALYLWARGNPWEQLLDRVPIDEGDMASLIMRTADHLRQVANLRETHSSLARMAEKGIGRILREPVYVA